MALAQIGKLALVAFGAVTLGPFALFGLPCPLPEFFDQLGPDRFRHGFGGGGRVDPRGGRGFWWSEHPDQFGHEEMSLAALKADLIAANVAGGNLALDGALADAEHLDGFGQGDSGLCHGVPSDGINGKDGIVPPVPLYGFIRKIKCDRWCHGATLALCHPCLFKNPRRAAIRQHPSTTEIGFDAVQGIEGDELEGPAVPESRQGQHAIHHPHGKAGIGRYGENAPRRVVPEGARGCVRDDVIHVRGKLFDDAAHVGEIVDFHGHGAALGAGVEIGQAIGDDVAPGGQIKTGCRTQAGQPRAPVGSGLVEIVAHLQAFAALVRRDPGIKGDAAVHIGGAVGEVVGVLHAADRIENFRHRAAQHVGHHLGPVLGQGVDARQAPLGVELWKFVGLDKVVAGPAG